MKPFGMAILILGVVACVLGFTPPVNAILVIGGATLILVGMRFWRDS